MCPLDAILGRFSIADAAGPIKEVVCIENQIFNEIHIKRIRQCTKAFTRCRKNTISRFNGREIRLCSTVFISSTILTDRVCKRYEKYKNIIIVYIRNLCPRSSVQGFRVVSLANHENPLDTTCCLKIHCIALKLKSVIANSTKRTRFEAARTKSLSVFLNWTLLKKHIF